MTGPSTGRIARLELRRSAAAVVAVLTFAAGTALLLTFPQGFAGRWLQLAVALRLLLMFLFPVALAGGAALGRREAAAGVGELFASTPRPRGQRMLVTAGVLAAALVGAYALTFLVALAWVLPRAGYFPPAAPAVTAVGALALVAGGWIGLAAGRAVPRFVTAPVLAVLGVAVAGMLPQWVALAPGRGEAPAALLLSPVYSGSLDDFQTVSARVSLVQALWLAALAATGLLLATARRRTVAPALLPAVLGAAVAVPLLPPGGYAAAAAYDPRAVELVCDDAGPQVCVTRVHAALLPDIAGPVRAALATLAATMPGAPARAVETRRPAYGTGPADPPHDAATLVFAAPPIGADGRADLRDGSFPGLVLGAAWEQSCDPAPADAFDGRELAVAWLTGTPPGARLAGAYAALRARPEDEQRRLVLAARDGVLACRPDAFAGLTT
ncbi:hypothetical protein ACQP1P_17545 [Dactylosporangium sp. CA-052675]|uniref:hypothetical protein n=1 Tax=Dactylosporangium sp. CA-052675 TaxID=3239927 RepID=UPI003D8BFF48